LTQHKCETKHSSPSSFDINLPAITPCFIFELGAALHSSLIPKSRNPKTEWSQKAQIFSPPILTLYRCVLLNAKPIDHRQQQEMSSLVVRESRCVLPQMKNKLTQRFSDHSLAFRINHAIFK